jgi:ribosomal protein S18 acetylase RimI-like enzyme
MNAIPTATGVSGSSGVLRYGSYADLPAPIGDDTLLLIETDPAVFYGAWAVEGGYAFSSLDVYGGDPCWLNVVGTSEAARLLTGIALGELGELGEKCTGMSITRGVDVREWAGEGRWNAWDLMRCDAEPPRQPGEERVVRIEDLASVQEFLDRASPTHSVPADHPEVEHWLGVAEESTGTLLAIGAFERRRRGTPYLASIATAPEARGQGLGGAVTAALTRHAFATGESLCTLAHFHPNDQARRLYLRLGYQTTHQMLSGPFDRETAVAD